MYSSDPNVRIGGMLIGYYIICPRKAWLSLRGLWMEQESDAVAMGRVIDKTSYSKRNKAIDLEATAPDGSVVVGKLDGADLQGGVLHETKKSRAVEEAHRMQVKFYLWLLKLCGVTRADGHPFGGQIDYPRLRRTESVELRPEDEAYLEEIIANICVLAQQPAPPPRLIRRAFCRKCAFEELCYA